MYFEIGQGKYTDQNELVYVAIKNGGALNGKSTMVCDCWLASAEISIGFGIIRFSLMNHTMVSGSCGSPCFIS